GISIGASHPAGSTMSRSSSDGATGRPPSTSSIHFTRRPEGRGGVRAPGKQRGRGAAAATLSARLIDRAALTLRPDGTLVATVDGYSLPLGRVGADAAAPVRGLCVQGLATGVPVDALAADPETEAVARRLAARGLLEYRLARASGGRKKQGEAVIIE